MKDNLHRIHAAPTGGNSVDIGARWRPEKELTHEQAKAVAHRMALCWNLCEGWPTEVLEAGALRDLDTLTREILDLEANSRPINAKLEKLRELHAKFDPAFDFTGGRPADCQGCYPTEGGLHMTAKNMVIMTTKKDRLNQTASLMIREYVRQGTPVMVISDEQPYEFVYDDGVEWLEAKSKEVLTWTPPDNTVTVISTASKKLGDAIHKRIATTNDDIVIIRCRFVAQEVHE